MKEDGHKLEIPTWANIGSLISLFIGLYSKTHNIINNYHILFYYPNLTCIHLVIVNSTFLLYPLF
jgi:hypothetical protein